VIEDCVVIEVGATVEAKHVGEGSIIEINARVGKGAVIGKVSYIRRYLSFSTNCAFIHSTAG
jgi:dynactin-6